jgi:hypothetical protein
MSNLAGAARSLGTLQRDEGDSEPVKKSLIRCPRNHKGHQGHKGYKGKHVPAFTLVSFVSFVVIDAE